MSKPRSSTPVPLKYPVSAELQRAFERLASIALRLPGVEVSRAYGTPALKVKGKPLARLRTEAEGGLALRCDFVDRQMLLQADPDVFYVTDHARVRSGWRGRLSAVALQRCPFP